MSLALIFDDEKPASENASVYLELNGFETINAVKIPLGGDK